MPTDNRNSSSSGSGGKPITDMTIAEVKHARHEVNLQITKLEQAKQSIGESSVTTSVLEPSESTNAAQQAAAVLFPLEVMLSQLYERRDLLAREEDLKRSLKHHAAAEAQSFREDVLAKQIEDSMARHTKQAKEAQDAVLEEAIYKNTTHAAKVEQIKDQLEHNQIQSINHLEKKIASHESRLKAREAKVALDIVRKRQVDAEKREKLLLRLEKHTNQITPAANSKAGGGEARQEGQLALDLLSDAKILPTSVSMHNVAGATSSSSSSAPGGGKTSAGHTRPSTPQHQHEGGGSGGGVLTHGSGSRAAQQLRRSNNASTNKQQQQQQGGAGADDKKMSSSGKPKYVTAKDAAVEARKLQRPPRGPSLAPLIDSHQSRHLDNAHREKQDLVETAKYKREIRESRHDAAMSQLDAQRQKKLDAIHSKQESQEKRMTQMKQAQQHFMAQMVAERDAKRESALRSSQVPPGRADRWASRARMLLESVCGNIAENISSSPSPSLLQHSHSHSNNHPSSMSDAKKPRHGFEASTSRR